MLHVHQVCLAATQQTLWSEEKNVIIIFMTSEVLAGGVSREIRPLFWYLTHSAIKRSSFLFF